jgi:hypothetical protein
MIQMINDPIKNPTVKAIGYFHIRLALSFCKASILVFSLRVNGGNELRCSPRDSIVLPRYEVKPLPGPIA